ncbi:hypothetical protein ACGFJ7_04875 [Actinoplanes sp. NPDC048988]|uniref:hypothetical protein n=1 Tax=Actinoplanes sp. NPDC048988 TaxID=3363901 RepID=UPI003710CF16
MLAADGGGGTNWYAMTIPDMQNLIQQPDTAKHYELLTGWKQSADLITEHRWQVQNYRDNLAAVWPPEKNEAARAYLTRLDELIQNLDETYEAALANHDAFASATLSISLAQKDIQAIHDEYMANAQLLTTFNTEQLQAQKADPDRTPTEKPPVPDGHQEQLRQKAAALLSTVSSDLALAQVSIRTPRPYQPKFTDDASQINDGSTYVAPPIPPITPSFAADSASGASSRRPEITFPSNTPPTGTPPLSSQPGIGAALPGIGGPQPGLGATQPGLILGGTTPTAAAPLGPPSIGLTPTPGVPGAAPGLGSNPVLFPPLGTLPTGGTPSTQPPVSGLGRGVSTPQEGLVRAIGPNSGGLHAMPPGGMIGAVPGGGLGQPGTARPGVSRVNPVGGVIGGGGPSAKAGMHGITGLEHAGGSAMPYGQGGQRRSGRTDSTDGTRWDPDNPWQTPEGVDPVVEPSRERRIDPGPAIGL